MYNIRLGYACGIKATLLTSTGAVFDLRKARYKGAVLMLPNGASIPCADVSIDDVTNSVYVRLLADRELTMIGKYGIMFNLKLANGVMYSSPMVVFAEVSADAEVEYKELNISLGVALTYLPANVAYTGASPKIGPNGTWLVYNDERNAYEDTGEPANYGGLLGEVQSLKDIIETSLTPHFITNAVKVDWKTIGKNADGELCYIGAGIGDNEGNIDIAILDGYLTDRGYAKHIDIAKEYATKEWVEKKKFITIDSLPQKISAFANDKGYITIDALAPYATLATTLGGYGITNAYTKTETDARIFGEVKRLFEDPRLVTAAVNIDGRTIKRDGNGALYVDETALSVSGGGGGGVADSVYWNNVIGKPSWIGSTKPTYKYSEIEEKPDLSVYAKLSDIPSLNGYATQSWVENKGYLLATTASSTYQPKITSSNKLAYSLISGTPDLSKYFLKSSFTKANIKSTLGISDWALASVKPTYKYSEIGNTPDLSVYALNTDLAKKWTQNDAKIANWDSAYGWGNHANAGYAKASDVTNEFKNYVKLAGDSQSITVQHNFTNGLKIGGLSLRKVDDYLYLDSSLVLSGGVTMYGDDGTTVKPIWESIPFDRTTIDWVNGMWTVVGGVGGGGISEEFLNAKLQGYQPLLSATNKLPYSLISGTPDLSVYALKTDIPTKLSQLTDNVVSGNYLSLVGGTIKGSVEIKNPTANTNFDSAIILNNNSYGAGATYAQVRVRGNGSNTRYGYINFNTNTNAYFAGFEVGKVNGDTVTPLMSLDGNGAVSFAGSITTRSNVYSWANAKTVGHIIAGHNASGNAAPIISTALASGGYGKLAQASDQFGLYAYSASDSTPSIRFALYPEDGEIRIMGNTIPISTTTYNLGSASAKWSNVYATSFIGNLTGNADSATKLATARTIWGNDFDGSAPISGNIIGKVPTWSIISGEQNIIRIATTGTIITPYDKESGWVAIRTGAENTTSGSNEIRLLSSGNVAIGSTTADAKLHVHGNAIINGDLTIPNNNSIKVKSSGGVVYSVLKMSTANSLSIGQESAANGRTTMIYGNLIRLRCGTGGTDALYVNASGNVTIGASDLAGATNKMYVDGTAKFTGDTTFSSKVVIGTIPVYQSADGTLFVDANVVFRGGVAMYGNTTTTINEE